MFAVIPRLSFCREPLLLITYRSRTVASHSSICTIFAFRFVDAWGLRPDEVSLHFCFWIRPALSAFALDNSTTTTTTPSCKVVIILSSLLFLCFLFLLLYFFRESNSKSLCSQNSLSISPRFSDSHSHTTPLITHTYIHCILHLEIFWHFIFIIFITKANSWWYLWICKQWNNNYDQDLHII